MTDTACAYLLRRAICLSTMERAIKRFAGPGAFALDNTLPWCPTLRAASFLAGPCLDARLDQLRREGGEVCFREGRGGDGPDRALVAAIRHDGHCFVKAAVILRTYPRFGKLSRLSLLAALPMI